MIAVKTGVEKKNGNHYGDLYERKIFVSKGDAEIELTDQEVLDLMSLLRVLSQDARRLPGDLGV